MAALIDKKDIGHIFRTAEGHVPDTPANRRLLVETCEPQNLLGNDKFGNSWYARTLADGRQAWVQARGNRIRNGGVNDTPRSFHAVTGLSKPEK
jgi:hypothetical protein